MSESCRLIDSKPVKHVVHGGTQVAPAVAVAGATALFAADLGVIAFTPALKKAPLLFNVIQGFVLFVSGDTYFQVSYDEQHARYCNTVLIIACDSVRQASLYCSL
jgi:hypothetical protein